MICSSTDMASRANFSKSYERLAGKLNAVTFLDPGDDDELANGAIRSVVGVDVGDSAMASLDVVVVLSTTFLAFVAAAVVVDRFVMVT